jgi:hypothetical protein
MTPEVMRYMIDSVIAPHCPGMTKDFTYRILIDGDGSHQDYGNLVHQADIGLHSFHNPPNTTHHTNLHDDGNGTGYTIVNISILTNPNPHPPKSQTPAYGNSAGGPPRSILTSL